jgi:molecular chaperone DnaK
MRSSRQEFAFRVRLAVAGKEAIAERFALNLSEGGLFIQDDRPPAVGSQVIIEFVLPDGRPLSRVAAQVAHSRPATFVGDKTAGMGLEFIELDTVARDIVGRLNRAKPAARRETEPDAGIFDLAGLEAPLITATGPIVGIDLGTVNSCVAVAPQGAPSVILSPQGYDTLPSVVFVSEGGELFVGHKALERMILAPERAVYGSKRFLGRPFISREVQTYGHFFNYDLVPDQLGRTAAGLGDQVVPLEMVSGHILRKLRDMATSHLDASVGRAVVTVPAYFGETQRQAVRDAGRLAGLTVVRILNEPTAAAVAYGFGRGLSSTVLVYDLGGGTFDATVLRIEGNTFEVLATDGDPFLGGADFDDRLTEYVLASFERDHLSLRRDPVAVQRIRFAVELAKRQLSEASQSRIDLPYIAQVDSGPVHLDMTISRELFERLTEDLVDRTLSLVQEVLDRAGVAGRDLDDVLLVGGQSRSPIVRRRLIERFGKRPSGAVHPTEAVAMGAAIVAEALHSDLMVHMADILPASIRRAREDGSTELLLARGTRLPAQAEFSLPATLNRMAAAQISLFRGEGERAEENTFLGALELPALQSPADAQVAARVLLRVSGDGLLSVIAYHPATGELSNLELLLNEK